MHGTSKVPKNPYQNRLFGSSKWSWIDQFSKETQFYNPILNEIGLDL